MLNLPPKMKILPILAKSSWKIEIWIFPVVRYFTWKLEFVSHILSLIVGYEYLDYQCKVCRWRMLKNHWNTPNICLFGETSKQTLSNFEPRRSWNLENRSNSEGSQWAWHVLWTSNGRLYEVRTSYRRPLDVQKMSDAKWAEAWH